MTLSYQTVSKTLTELPMFEFQSVRRSFPRNLAENSEAASFVAYLLSYTVSVEKCGYRIHVLFMMYDVY
jgi:hypothetical protein